ncbi:multiple sugar transport system permease protein/sn-glycerol 3-phosphate transport system permease protein [Kribbella steppae]|uniref:Multiple sugar transport system permease protein/sn-glycerol 3-phosphate transport system permease protein n=1 Tax=Kribbella steppae TaxID=2512223 RepID=A0A4R2H6U7_9ACTN|nr:sugar ABC transporter permease [Kribbella steppae]TCO21104.1 multiple sugar transport system permease protein/sn-glycerol 3-phosphate transport system permease protein [Kribbella steppae]
MSVLTSRIPLSRTASKREKPRSWSAVIFLAPFGLLFLFLWAVPIIRGFYLSLTDVNVAEGTGGFVGLANYTNLFGDGDFQAALGHTVLFVVLNVPVLVAAGLILALVLNRDLSGRNMLRAAFVGPYLLPGAAVALIWTLVLDPVDGSLNTILKAVGLPVQQWLTEPGQAMGAVVLLTLWWRVGFPLLILLAALQDIPKQLYESARIDGAGRWQQFVYVTSPGIAPVLGLVVLLRLIDSFKVFEQVYLLTQGGPSGSTRVVLQMLYETGFRDFRTGYAAAIGWLLALIILVVTVVHQVVSRRSVKS